MRLVEGRTEIENLDEFLDRLAVIGTEFGCAVQAFDARYVAGPTHLRTAVEHADRSFERGENVARDPAVEILLYAAGRRQIDQALEMGVSTGQQDAVVVVHGEDGDEAGAADAVGELLEPMETAGTGNEDVDAITEFFSITDAERAATDASLEELVCERVVLLDVEK